MATRHAAEWAVGQRLVRDDAELARWQNSHAADFWCSMVPKASTERHQLGAEWCYWAFSLDDACCDQGSNATSTQWIITVAARLLRLLRIPDERLCGQPRPAGAVRSGPVVTPAGHRDPIRAVGRHTAPVVVGVVQQVDHRAREKPPTSTTTSCPAPRKLCSRVPIATPSTS